MRIWMLAVLSMTLACATTEQAAPRTYTESAQVVYEQALEELESEDFEQAVILFERVRTRYPYSSFAALAELGVADTQYKRGRFLEAIDAYLAFTKFHPAHAKLDYATFRVGESHYRSIPSAFFLFPPPSERDQTEVRSTRAALQDFLHRFPESEHTPRAQELLQQVLQTLGKHEMEAARFYAKREKWQGAAGRYRYLLRTYPGSGFDGEATLGLAVALRELGETDEAKRVLTDYLAAGPNGQDAAEARRLLGEIEGSASAP